MADHVWEASRGGLNRLSRVELGDRFAAYFATVKYLVWEDLQPPHVAVGVDAVTAWMAVEIEARLSGADDTGKQREVGFESSWIAVYEKVDGTWLMVGISSSVVERR